MTSRRPLVLVHGFPLDGRMWNGAIPEEEGRAVLCLDLPGFGGREALPPPGTVEGYARWVLARAQEAAAGPYLFGGLSMGGYVLFEILRIAPRAVAGLILADTRAEPDTGEGRLARNDAIALVLGGRRTEFLHSFGARLVHASGPTAAEAGSRLRSMMHAASEEGLRYALEAIRDRSDSRPRLGEITVPTLVVVGEKDAVTPPATAESLHFGIRGSRLAVIPQAGHLPPVENPGAFRAALADFLREAGL